MITDFHTLQSTIRRDSSNNTPNSLLTAAGVKYPMHMDRTVYLAYAFLRGIPYRVVEPTARPLFESMGCYRIVFCENIAKLMNHVNREVVHQPEAPDKGILGTVMDKLLGKEEPPPAPKVYTTKDPATTGTIEAWMAVPETDARKAKRAAREEKSRQTKAVKRQVFLNTARRVTQAHGQAS